VNAETREYAKREVSKRRLEQVAPFTLAARKAHNDEIVRQYVENQIPTETIADLMQMKHWRVRQILRSKGIITERRPLRVTSSHHSSRITVPASLSKALPPDARFTCELVDEGILYRRVEGEAA
jgi:hypothetical protein